MILWHVTDTHLGRCGGRGEEALAAAVAGMLAPGHEFDLLLLTGDLGQLALLRKLLEPIRGRVIVCPGNHDYSEPGLLEGITFSPEAEREFLAFCGWVGSPRPGTMFCPAGTDLLFVGLDSCRKSPFAGDLARGRLGNRQFDRLAGAKEAAAAHHLRLVILIHHDSTDRDPTMTLEDGDRFLAEAYGSAWLIVCGHTHGLGWSWTATTGRPTLMRRGQDAVGGGADAVWSIEA